MKAAGLGDLLKKLGFSGTKCHANSLARRARTAESSRVSALQYIYGTPEERNICVASSYGWIRMRSADVISLYETSGRCTRRHHANALQTGGASGARGRRNRLTETGRAFEREPFCCPGEAFLHRTTTRVLQFTREWSILVARGAPDPAPPDRRFLSLKTPRKSIIALNNPCAPQPNAYFPILPRGGAAW
jgi:hypothetical protein